MQERQKKITELLKKNNYDFKVLLDFPEQEGAYEFVTAGKYKVNTIPAKIIISPKGKIKFVSNGYSPGDEKLVEELSLMIELAKKS